MANRYEHKCRGLRATLELTPSLDCGCVPLQRMGHGEYARVGASTHSWSGSHSIHRRAFIIFPRKHGSSRLTYSNLVIRVESENGGELRSVKSNLDEQAPRPYLQGQRLPTRRPTTWQSSQQHQIFISSESESIILLSEL